MPHQNTNLPDFIVFVIFLDICASTMGDTFNAIIKHLLKFVCEKSLYKYYLF